MHYRGELNIDEENGVTSNSVTSFFFFLFSLKPDFSKLLSKMKILPKSFCPKKISSPCIFGEMIKTFTFANGKVKLFLTWGS